MAHRCGRVTRTIFLCATSTGNSLKSIPVRPPTCRKAFRNHSASNRQQFSFQRLPEELASVQSLMPLHSAVAAVLLTSRLNMNINSRSLSQELGLSAPR